MKTVERFSDRVENYVKYRPTYPAEILQLFCDEMNLQSDSVVADIGAGTGISAKMFLENGNRVFGVEPNTAMQNAAVEFLKGYSQFTLVDGTLESTTLDSGAVGFIVAAQAFHWFKHEETRKEFRRILKDKGFVALIWNERQLDSTDFFARIRKFSSPICDRLQRSASRKRLQRSYRQVFSDGIPAADIPNFTNFRLRGFGRQIAFIILHADRRTSAFCGDD